MTDSKTLQAAHEAVKLLYPKREQEALALLRRQEAKGLEKYDATLDKFWLPVKMLEHGIEENADGTMYSTRAMFLIGEKYPELLPLLEEYLACNARALAVGLTLSERLKELEG